MELFLKFLLVLSAACLAAADPLKVKRERKRQAFEKHIEMLREFSTDLYDKLAKAHRDQNLIFSPYSVQSGLMMLVMGAKGETKKQIRAAMRMGRDRLLRNNTRTLRSRMESLPAGYFFETANTIFSQNGSSISADYIDVVRRVMGTMPKTVDYRLPAEARDTINRWVEKKTKNKIKNLIPDGVLDKFVRMVLVNAVYFKADWKTKFHANDTLQAPFHTLYEEDVVDMMDVTSVFNYMESQECEAKAIEMFYTGDKMSMVVILPQRKTNRLQFDDFQTCVQQKLGPIMKDMQQSAVHVSLPKFRMTQNFDLKDALKRMSISDVFVPSLANLTGIDPTGDLYVSDVLHKAFIEVTEEGSEAAAATALISRGRSDFGREPEVKQFIANHPFIFFIKHKTDGIMFMGRFLKP